MRNILSIQQVSYFPKEIREKIYYYYIDFYRQK